MGALKGANFTRRRAVVHFSHDCLCKTRRAAGGVVVLASGVECASARVDELIFCMHCVRGGEGRCVKEPRPSADDHAACGRCVCFLCAP